MFASLPIERELFTYKDLLPGTLYWVTSVGGYATIGLVLWLILGYTLMKRKDKQAIPQWVSVSFGVAATLAICCYVSYWGALYAKPPPPLEFTGDGVPIPRKNIILHDYLGAFGGACALYAVLMPFALSFGSLSLRRIWALARLSFKEAIRRRVLWILTIPLLIFLFASWFIPSKSESQISTYVSVVEFVMSRLLLIAAVILASFSIPNDIKQQTIHTVLTKPVQRFEIVLGRFLGYSALMTLVLMAMSAISLLYLVWEVDPDAAAESLKARDPLWGDLRFEGTGSESKGINVGKEWEYRSYISYMPGQPASFAIWDFRDFSPSTFANRQTVRCEYTFDIFRSTKGYEGKGISCAFYVRTANYKKGNEDAFQKELESYRSGKTDPSRKEVDVLNELCEKYGYFEVPATAVSSGHTYSLDLPAGLFKSMDKPDEARRREAQQNGKTVSPLEVRVECKSATQYVGVAKHDFWLRQDDPNSGHDKLWFAYNFFKAQAVNLWLKLLVVIGVSVSLSTYLSGVISLIVAVVLYVGGYVLNFFQSVAFGKNYGGGPFKSAYQLFHREMPGQDLNPDMTAQALLLSDEFVKFGMRRVLDLFPDVDRFDFTRFVQEGFNIPESQILLNFVLMAAYVLPWLVLAYYLMKWKEVASAT
jgi:ABC-type transport system involved in multi-copper enzyme maturation permease subunit